MKKILVFSLMFAIALSCCQSVPRGSNKCHISEGEPTTIIMIASKLDYEKARKNYQDNLFCDTLSAIKRNNSLILPLKAPNYPPSVVLIDTLWDSDDTNQSFYSYLGQFQELGFYLVRGNFYENAEYYLINKETGRRTITWNRPYLSPSSEFIANISAPYGLEGRPNGIQVWKIDNSSLEIISKYFEIDQQIWAPLEFVWETDDTIITKVINIEKYCDANGNINNCDYYFLKIILK